MNLHIWTPNITWLFRLIYSTQEEKKNQFLGLPAFSNVELVVLAVLQPSGTYLLTYQFGWASISLAGWSCHILPHHGLKKSHFNTLDFPFQPDNYNNYPASHQKKSNRGNWCGRRGEATQIPLLFLREGLGERMQISQAEKGRGMKNGGGRNLKHLFDFNLATLRAFKVPSSVYRRRLLPISCYQCWKWKF